MTIEPKSSMSGPGEQPQPKTVGYWYNPHEARHLPMPVAQDQKWDGQDEFVAKLAALEAALTERHAAQSAAAWKRYLDERKYPSGMIDDTVVEYRGWSTCRCCKKMNGIREFNLYGWTWPEGYIHYLRDHNVLPDEGFRQFIMSHDLAPQEGTSDV